ncbi:HPr kinase/phosphatase C-terminal domain-containing protein [Sphingosinicella sp. LHD-64]|uniref:HPr kinase/phosphorylase n=1 Tax=Sphingosinicella sp. LHD-64 TaxID=3072139 RepID=UPI00280D8A8C|nr:HPr kinase/phosphatase C-terminal domain-containing protein [Sphingosinicella sp. LHD-64]MDQ8755021.1 HPr kinase/phosphatase C-terminal domain-containing protein [Sphingosinicella sp. LHD-64]
MKNPILSSETVHVSAVSIDGRAVLIGGLSGRGKSDLALRLIDRGARLVSDDYTIVRRVDGRLLAGAPPNIAGRIEVRGVGILEFPNDEGVPVALIVDLGLEPERLPSEGETRTLAGISVPVIGLAGLEASAPIKVEAALKLFGLKS